MSYTPGPWGYEENYDGVFEIRGPKGESVACGDFSARSIANARLIAAAPEMYKAVEQLSLIAMNYYLRLQSEQKNMFKDLEMRDVKYWIDKGNALLNRVDGKEEPE